MLPIPEIDEILSGAVEEGQTLDFKQSLDLTGNAKLHIVDDVVAFLNSDGGTIVVGVAERKGQLPVLAPVTGDADRLAMQLQDILVSTIKEQPDGIRVETRSVDGGFLLIIRIGRSNLRPHCNGATGRYIRRRGRKNEPLLPGQLAALREGRERLVAIAKLDAPLDEGETGFAQGPRFDLRVVPIEHLDIGAPAFEHMKSPFLPKGFPAAHGQWKPFSRFSDGYGVEAVDFDGLVISRFTVGDDWIVRSSIVHPIPYQEEEGRLSWGTFETEMVRHFRSIGEFLTSESLTGIYAVDMAIAGLHKRTWGQASFRRGDRVGLGRPTLVDPFVAEALASKLVALVRQASIFG